MPDCRAISLAVDEVSLAVDEVSLAVEKAETVEKVERAVWKVSLAVWTIDMPVVLMPGRCRLSDNHPATRCLSVVSSGKHARGTTA